MDFYAEKFVIFLLVFIRTVSMFATAPLYGNQAIPGQLKIWARGFFCVCDISIGGCHDVFGLD